MKQKKYYPLKFNKFLYAIAPVTALIAVPVIVLRIINIVNMTGAADMYTPAIDITVIALLIIILTLIVTCTFIARYELSQKYLIMRMGIFFQKIKIADIFDATYFRANEKVLLSYKTPTGIKQIAVTIDPLKIDDFTDSLVSLNRDIIYNVDSDEL